MTHPHNSQKNENIQKNPFNFVYDNYFLFCCKCSNNRFGKKDFERRVRERVALMNDYISYMVDKKKGISTRKYYKNPLAELI